MQLNYSLKSSIYDSLSTNQYHLLLLSMESTKQSKQSSNVKKASLKKSNTKDSGEIPNVSNKIAAKTKPAKKTAVVTKTKEKAKSTASSSAFSSVASTPTNSPIPPVVAEKVDPAKEKPPKKKPVKKVSSPVEPDKKSVPNK